MNELALFAGAGGGILGGHLLGWRCVCAVEYDNYARGVLLARQRDGCLPRFPIWDDVRTFDGRPWRGVVDVVSGGFPCQDISSAGKGAGIEGARSGLWKEMARIIGEVRPRFAFVENSPLLIRRGLSTVLSDLAEMGYDAAWGIVSAADCGAPHLRKRIWIVGWDAYSISELQKRKLFAGFNDTSGIGTKNPNAGCQHESRSEERPATKETQKRCAGAVQPERLCKDVADSDSMRKQQSQGIEQDERRWFSDSGNVRDTLREGLEGQRKQSSGNESKQRDTGKSSWWEAEPNVGRVANGVAARVDRLRSIGNGQVPVVAATAWRELIKLIMEQDV